jgi:hypothetical protein
MSKKKALKIIFNISFPIGFILWILPFILLNNQGKEVYLLINGVTFFVFILTVFVFLTHLILSCIYIFIRFIYYSITGKIDNEKNISILKY